MSQRTTPGCPELVVLGAGLPRTGTLSLYTALEILGLRCHHMRKVFEDGPQAARHWTKLMGNLLNDDEVTREQLGQALKGYKASVDAPSCEFVEALVRENPGLKVVLTSRSGASWLESFHATIGRICTSRVVWPTIVFWLPNVYEQWKLASALHKVWLSKYGTLKPEIMDLRIQEIREIVPRAQLLEFRVQEGWEPLCAFLGMPVPDVPFPRVNDSDSMSRRIKGMVIQGLTRWSLVLSAGFAALFIARTLIF